MIGFIPLENVPEPLLAVRGDDLGGDFIEMNADMFLANKLQRFRTERLQLIPDTAGIGDPYGTLRKILPSHEPVQQR